MRSIKLFEDFNNFYLKITHDEYNNGLNKIESFNRKYGNRILEVIEHHKKELKLDDIDLYVSCKDINGDLYTSDGYSDTIYEVPILSYSKNVTKSEYIRVDIEMIQSEDEYFYTSVTKIKYKNGNPANIPGRNRFQKDFYKCDQFEGLLQFLCDEIENSMTLSY